MINKFTEEELRVAKLITKTQKTFSAKHPLIVTFGGALGLVCTFYGFEKLIDKIDLFNNNPWILLATGLLLLGVTGSFYNKLK